MNAPWLSVILGLPMAGAVLLLVVPRRAVGLVKAWTVLIAVIEAGLVAVVLANFTGTASSSGPLPMHFQEQYRWIDFSGFRASYHVGIDGISAWILALNAGVFLLGALVVSARSTERLKFYCGLLLLTETATTGVLLSLDLLLFYVFWEAMLIPLYLLLSNFGGENRGRATLKFIIYTVFGSLLMLLAIIYLYVQSGQGSFDIQTLLLHPGPGHDRVTVPLLGLQTLTPHQIAFLAFAIAFAIKLPLVPFHTWLPALYEACPPAALVFFAGVVSKLGAFGFIRYTLTLFSGPVHDFQPLLLALAVLGIIYGALMALAESDLKRIVAYSSISHLGFIGLGIFSLNNNGLNGALIQIVNHGIIISALFLVVGMIEQRTGTRDRHELAGLEKRMPWLYFFFLIITLAGLGLPGMNTFVGEFSIMLGAFQSSWVWAVLAGVGVVLASWYMLRLHQGLMHNRGSEPRTENVRDIRTTEGLILAPLVALMVGLGIYPKPVGTVTAPTVSTYVSRVSAPTQTTSATTLPGARP
ncbi:MAG: complex I subunit 4 family protein [Candidatus Dormibacteria bacterium]